MIEATGDSGQWQQRLEEMAGARGVPAASLAVLHDGALTTAVTGTLNRDSGVAATTDSVFQLASITKVYTATAAMRLVEAGALDLDAPIRAVMPEFRVADRETTEAVTARHLLCHTSGIAGDFFADTGRGDDALERYVALCADLGQDIPFGATMSYSNTGYAILGRLIERATGQVWDDAMREQLFAPLGLRRTVTLPEDALRFRTAWGHVRDGDGALVPAPTWGPARALGPAGWVCASAEDVVRFAALFLDDGVAADGKRVLSSASIAEMLTPQVAVSDRWGAADHWGLGWWLHDWDGRRLYGHDGASPSGQMAFLKLVPDRRLAIALLVNGGDGEQLVKDVHAELLPSLAGIEPLVWPTPIEASDASAAGAVAGRYERLGVRVDIDLRDGALHGSTRLIEPLASQLPPQPVREFAIRRSTGGDAVYVARTDPAADTWWPLVFAEIGGERYLHFGGRALRSIG
jgi:CubicO group peptidase (beta-lactamase class C family)